MKQRLHSSLHVVEAVIVVVVVVVIVGSGKLTSWLSTYDVDVDVMFTVVMPIDDVVMFLTMVNMTTTSTSTSPPSTMSSCS